MFSPGMPSGFSLYESGDGGRSGACGREGDSRNVTACRRTGNEDGEGDEDEEARRDALPTTCKVERYNVVESAILPATESVY